MALVGTGSDSIYSDSFAYRTNWSVSMWFKSTSIGTNQYIICTGPANGPSEDYGAAINGNSLWIGSYISPAGNAASSGASAMSNGVWYHLCGFWRSATHRSVFPQNNMTRVDNTTSVTTTTPTRTVIGEAWYAAAFSSGIIGKLAHVGIWATELSTNEFEALRAGFSPKKIRPAGLTDYWPLINTKQGIMRTEVLSNHGSPTFDEDGPRIYN